jgi:hypothetical protein
MCGGGGGREGVAWGGGIAAEDAGKSVGRGRTRD